MRILVSNDDGIFAPGVRTLAEKLAENTDNEIYVVAPDRERSCAGHALTLHEPIWVDSLPTFGNIKNVWSCSGSPADCVKLGIRELMPARPDLIVSGINSVANMGSVIIYSGTVAAAAEGAMLGIPSIAVSLISRGISPEYEWPADFMSKFVLLMPHAPISPHTLLNINIPNGSPGEIQGIAITEAGDYLFEESFEKRVDPRGRAYYWLTGAPKNHEVSTNSDIYAARRNQISITPLMFNLTDHVSLPTLHAVRDMAHELLPLSNLSTTSNAQ